jgi:hypothetical protein
VSWTQGTDLCSTFGWIRAPGAGSRDPHFLYAALDTAADAAFIKESRMKFANANKLDRKYGDPQQAGLLG